MEVFPNPGATNGMGGSPGLKPGVHRSTPGPELRIKSGAAGAPSGPHIGGFPIELSPTAPCQAPQPLSPLMAPHTAQVTGSPGPLAAVCGMLHCTCNPFSHILRCCSTSFSVTAMGKPSAA